MNNVISMSSHFQVKLRQVKSDIVCPPGMSNSEKESFRDSVYDAAMILNDENKMTSYAEMRPNHWANIVRDSEDAYNGKGIIYDEHHRAEVDLKNLSEKLDASERKYARIHEKMSSNKTKKWSIFAVESVLLTFTMWGIIGLSDYPSLSLVPADDWAMFSFGTLTVLGVLFFGVGPTKGTAAIRFVVALSFFFLRSYVLFTSGEIGTPYSFLSMILAGLVPILTYYAYIIDSENETFTKEISSMEDAGETPEYWNNLIAKQKMVVKNLSEQFSAMDIAIKMPEVIENLWESQVSSTSSKIIQAHEDINRQNHRFNTYGTKIGPKTFSLIH